MPHRAILCAAILAFGLVAAAPSPAPALEARTCLGGRAPTCNTATNRQCWTSGFNINTDYETSTPTTGVTRTYTLTISEVSNWVGGDGGRKKVAMLVNGGYPGPTLTADWGDRINVTVVNNLITNGTDIHWHGVRQLNTNTMDGTPGLTGCPIPPMGNTGNSKTYSFLATQYGTSWYHSHFSSQFGNGVAGPIVINGPTSANWDIDLGPLMVSDWYYAGMNELLARVNDPRNPFIPGFPGAPPTSDNVLFNGQNINPNGGGGSYRRMTLTPGKVHLLRLINPSADNTYTVSLVGHQMTIIATDFVPVKPQTVSSLYMAIGQRYDVLINATQPVGNYWFNATLPTGPCGLSRNPRPAMIFSYTGASGGNPTNPGTVPPDQRCQDLTNFSPVVTRTAPVASFTPTPGDTLETHIETSRNGVAHVYWPVNNSPMNVSWNDPTLEYVRDGRVASMPREENVYISTPNTTTFWLIVNNSSIPHPVHLHGHDILIVGGSPALANPLAPGNTLRTYNPATDGPTLKGNNPTRRDTTQLPAWGWLVVAYTTNNPGAWLFHCHTVWHVSQGLSVQFLEQLDAIPQKVDLSALEPNCRNWDSYYPAKDPYKKDDSGV